MKNITSRILGTVLLCWIITTPGYAQENGNSVSAEATKTVLIRKTNDFHITGDGTADNWGKTSWIDIVQRTASASKLTTRAKILYSSTGIYVLFNCQDNRLTVTLQKDFLDLWNEDVVEVFLQPEPGKPAYFEYELSPLNFELPIIIFNESGKLNSWQPFHYEADRKTQHATNITGGERKTNASVEGWTAEIFLPYQLMRPVLNKRPASGSSWKGNLYRIDYDSGESLWSWQLNSGNFHEYEKFGIFLFE